MAGESLKLGKEKFAAYQERAVGIGSKILNVSDEHAKKMPFNVESIAKRVLDSDQGEKFKKLVENDINTIVKLHGGVAPFDAADYPGMSTEDAKAKWESEYLAVEDIRESKMIELATLGVVAMRLFPRVAKSANASLRKGKKTKASVTSPASRTKRNKRKPKAETLEDLSNTFDQALGKF